MINETGSGVTDADSYVALADATAYHTARLNEDWADATDADRTAALIRATDYIELTYLAINTLPATTTQGLQWPRYGETALPGALKRATMILAAEALSQALIVRKERETNQNWEKLDGVGELRTVLDPDPVTDHYPQVTDLMRPIASRRAAGVGFSRVTREYDRSIPMGDPSFLGLPYGSDTGLDGYGIGIGPDGDL